MLQMLLNDATQRSNNSFIFQYITTTTTIHLLTMLHMQRRKPTSVSSNNLNIHDFLFTILLARLV